MAETYTTATQYASAEILCTAAADMLGDASRIMTEVKDKQAHKELTALADKVGVAIERLQRKRMEAEAAAHDH